MNSARTSITIALLAICFTGFGAETGALYRITAIYVEGPIRDFSHAGWEFGPGSIDAPTDYTLPDTSTVQVVRFPILTLRQGESGTIDNRYPVRYPNNFDIQTGQPTDFATHGVGTGITARVDSEVNGLVIMSIELQNVHEPEWRTDELGHGLPPVLLPFFHSRNISMPSTTLYTNSWMVMGGPVSSTSAGTNVMVHMIQVTKD